MLQVLKSMQFQKQVLIVTNCNLNVAGIKKYAIPKTGINRNKL